MSPAGRWTGEIGLAESLKTYPVGIMRRPLHSALAVFSFSAFRPHSRCLRSPLDEACGATRWKRCEDPWDFNPGSSNPFRPGRGHGHRSRELTTSVNQSSGSRSRLRTEHLDDRPDRPPPHHQRDNARHPKSQWDGQCLKPRNAELIRTSQGVKRARSRRLPGSRGLTRLPPSFSAAGQSTLLPHLATHAAPTRRVGEAKQRPKAPATEARADRRCLPGAAQMEWPPTDSGSRSSRAAFPQSPHPRACAAARSGRMVRPRH